MGLTVAFGGGTARAMAHVGVLLALNEAGIRPAAAAGTSFGAIVAALFALDVAPDEMARLLTAHPVRRIWAQGLDFGLHRLSLVHGRRLERWLDETLYHGATFSDLKKPLALATTSLDDGELQLVQEGPIARAVLASCSLPLLFAPVEIDGKWLVDGGFVEAVPFRAAVLLDTGPVLGINTGIDTENASMVRVLRGLRQRRWARSFSDWSVARPTGTATGRAARGLGWAARSYAREQLLPEGATLLRVDPGIAWWDFHRMQSAVAAGLEAGRQAVAAGLVPRPEPLNDPPEVDDAQSGQLVADGTE